MAPIPGHTSLNVFANKHPLQFWLVAVFILFAAGLGIGLVVYVICSLRRNFALVDPLTPLYERLENPPCYLYLARLLNFGRPVSMKSSWLYGLQGKLERWYKRRNERRLSAQWRAFKERLQTKFTPSLPSSVTASSSFRCAGPGGWMSKSFNDLSGMLKRPEPAVLKDGKRISSQSPTNYNFVPTLPSLAELNDSDDGYSSSRWSGDSCYTPSFDSPIPTIVVLEAPDIQQSSFVDAYSPALASLPVSPAIKYLEVPVPIADDEDEDTDDEHEDYMRNYDYASDWDFLYDELDIPVVIHSLASRARKPLQLAEGHKNYPRMI